MGCIQDEVETHMRFRWCLYMNFAWAKAKILHIITNNLSHKRGI